MKANPTSPAGKKLGTLDHLDNVAQNLYRHRGTGGYWAVKKMAGKRTLHDLATTDRKSADGRLREWLDDLDKVNPGNADLNLAMLLQKFRLARGAKAPSTIASEKTMSEEFERSFPRPMDTLVARVVHSDIAAWLAIIRPGKKGRTFNRWRLFAHQLFKLAEADGAVKKSPSNGRLNRPAKKDKVIRRIPTEDEFVKLIAEIRQPDWKLGVGRHGGQRPMFQHESADFIEFLGRAGVGQAEAKSLRWEFIDERTMTWTRKKTSGDLRVNITDDLRPLLARRREAAGGVNASGPVFKIKNAKHALARLGMPHITQRNLRSFKVVRMLEAGLDVKFVSEQQGHKDGGKLIYDTYSDVVRRNQRAYEDEQMARLNRKVVPFIAAAA